MSADFDNTISFEEPPPILSGPGNGFRWEDHLTPLRERPNEWAVVRTGPHRTIQVTASHLRLGKIAPGLNRDEWEFTSRRSGEDEAKLYARFVGEPAAEPTPLRRGSAA